MTQIRVKVLRSFCVRGEPLAVGAVVALAPLDAHAALGKCELVDPLDREVIAQAVQEANRAALLLAGRQRRENSFGPWQR